MIMKKQRSQNKQQNGMPVRAKLYSNDEKFEIIDIESNSFISEASESLRRKGIYYITGEISVESLQDIQQDILLKHLTPTWQDDIQLIINSPGGYTDGGWAFVDLLSFIRMDVRTVGIGEICSFGSMLVACGTHGKRSVTKSTNIMIHGISGGLFGNEHQIAAMQKMFTHEANKTSNFWIEHSRYKTKEEIEKHFIKSTDVWLTPEEALNHGIIDGIIGKESIKSSNYEENKYSRKIKRKDS